MAQRTVDPVQSHAWGENIGWTNWRHDTSACGGVLVHSNYLEGYVWGENVGWIEVGSGPGPYANTTGLNFGVNLDPGTGLLTGMAWGENIGWINFAGGGLATPANAARFASSSCRFRGYVWGENVGWINLDDATYYIGVLLDGDLDGDGDVDLADLATLLAHFGTTSGASPEDGDLNCDGAVDLVDLARMLASFGSLCS